MMFFIKPQALLLAMKNVSDWAYCKLKALKIEFGWLVFYVLFVEQSKNRWQPTNCMKGLLADPEKAYEDGK